MKKFSFRFKQLSRIRKHKEEEAMLALARAQKKYFQEVEAKTALQRDLVRALEERTALASGAHQQGTYLTYDDFIEGTKVRMLQADRRIAREQKRLDQRMKFFLEKRRDRMALDRLREKQWKEYRRVRDRKEGMEATDLFSARAGGRDR